MKRIHIVIGPNNQIYAAFQSRYDADKCAKRLNKVINTHYIVTNTAFYFYKGN